MESSQRWRIAEHWEDGIKDWICALLGFAFLNHSVAVVAIDEFISVVDDESRKMTCDISVVVVTQQPNPTNCKIP